MDGTLFFILIVLFGVFALGGILYAALNRDGAIPLDEATPYRTGGNYASKELDTAAVPAHRTQLRELTREERIHFEDAWRDVRSGFIEDPKCAAQEADSLARELLEARGYSVSEIDGEIWGPGIDRSGPVEDYRTARALASAHEIEPEAGDDRMLQAMGHYQSFFAELLVVPPAAA
jgi:hypothetical protein